MSFEDGLVDISDLSRETRIAWAKLSFDMDWEDLDEGDKTWLTIEHAASLFFRLRATEDRPEYFPKGKWASIQRLESIIDSNMQVGRLT